MKKNMIRIFLGCLMITALLSCGNKGRTVVAEAEMNVVPLPVEYTFSEGEFTLTPATVIYDASTTNLPDMDKVLKACQRYSKDWFGKELATKKGNGDSKGIVLLADVAIPQEGYQLKVTNDQIVIASSTAQGLFYGLQSLRQMVPAECYGATDIAKIKLPCVTINDEPKFEYRCALLDAARHFMTVDEVKSLIDIIALHKGNTFHFHITDDQGWRIEIKKYPELTQIGSQRKETVIGHNTPEYDGTPYGGFYTQDEIKEIVAYAADNFVNVIPELDLPGHMQAALATYPRLGCRGADYPYEVRTKWGVSKEVLCAGNDEIYEFLENVLTEMMELFPYKYFHIGGDECPKDEWKECPKCQARIKAEGLKDEFELQTFVMDTIEKFLNAHGREIIGWEEIVQGGVSKTAIIMHWRYDDMANIAMENGNRMIMCPLSHCYLDYFQSPDSIKQPGYGHYIPIDTAYSFDPYKGLTDDQKKQIWGVQSNAWTEYACNMDEVTYMFLPRYAALAEVGWTYDNRDFNDFCRRMGSLRKLYDFYGWNYGSRQIFGDNEKLDYTPIRK